MSVSTFRDQVQAHWERAKTSEVSALRAEILATEGQITCLEGPLTPLDAAAFHRNRALASLAAEDRPGAVAAAEAALRLQPDAASKWASQLDVFAALIAEPSPVPPAERLVTSLGAKVVSDGVDGAQRVPGQPAIVQIFDPDGTALQGAWIAPRQQTPSWVSFPPPLCDGDVSLQVLLGHVRAAEVAYSELDVDGFGAALQQVAIDLPCMDQVIPPVAASSIHRLEGIRLSTIRDRLGTVRSFRAAQVLDPSYLPEEELMQPGSSMARLWDQAGSAAPSPWLPMDLPEGVEPWVDGLPSRSRPATLPAMVQMVGASGQVVWTRFLPATAAMPNVDSVVEDVEPDALQAASPGMLIYQDMQARRDRRRSRLPQRVVGATLLVGAAAAFTANAYANAAYQDPGLRPDLYRSRQRVVNSTFATGSALALGGLGLVVAAEF